MDQKSTFIGKSITLLTHYSMKEINHKLQSISAQKVACRCYGLTTLFQTCRTTFNNIRTSVTYKESALLDISLIWMVIDKYPDIKTATYKKMLPVFWSFRSIVGLNNKASFQNRFIFQDQQIHNVVMAKYGWHDQSKTFRSIFPRNVLRFFILPAILMRFHFW